MLKPLADRLWAKVNKNGPVMPGMNTPCWVWTRSSNEWGYGLITTEKSKRTRVHRISYELHFGPIPAGRLVLHRCDNPPCVRPGHLFLGDHAGNAADRNAKGRQARLAGESNGASKLTAELVAAIRAEAGQGGTTQIALAAKFGISKGQVSKIVNRLKWSTIP